MRPLTDEKNTVKPTATATPIAASTQTAISSTRFRRLFRWISRVYSRLPARREYARALSAVVERGMSVPTCPCGPRGPTIDERTWSDVRFTRRDDETSLRR